MRFLPVPENECERIAFILKLQPMFIVNSYALAVLFCFITMMCWGSWGNTQKLASKSWRYELFYWDYVIGMVLFLGFFVIMLNQDIQRLITGFWS